MDDNKIKFIEEAKIKEEIKSKKLDEIFKGVSNPIRANLMKFVQFKNKFNLKDLP